MTRDRARELGTMLAPYTQLYSAADVAASAEVAAEIRVARANLTDDLVKQDALALRESSAHEEERSLGFLARDLAMLRQRAPHTFSAFKGVFYTVLACILSFTDIPILGQVIARFLGHPWRNRATNLTFPQELLRDPLKTFQHFPDLMGLCISVVILGFFMKVWRDSLRARLAPGGAEDRTTRWDFRLDSAVFSIALLCLVLVAMMRLKVSLGGGGTLGDSMFARSASAVLGFTLPVLGAAFFTKGYDALANFAKLMWVSARLRVARFGLAIVERRRRRFDIKIRNSEYEFSRVSSAGYRELRRACIMEEFDSEYRTAVGATMMRAVEGQATRVLLAAAAVRQAIDSADGG